MNADSVNSIRPADVNDPLYYLKNFTTALNWVLAHSRDLLSAEETTRLDRFATLSQDAQALLLRMVMRKGELFFPSALIYSEISDTEQAASELAQQAFCTLDPLLTADELTALLKKDELLALLQRHAHESLPDNIKRWKKAELAQLVSELLGDSDSKQDNDRTLRPASEWLGTEEMNSEEKKDKALIRLDVMPLFDTIRLLFFGNGWQNWSEFVVTELGHLSYEAVPLDQSSRPFHQRAELDFYHQLADLQQQLFLITEQLKYKQLSSDEGAAFIAQCAQSLMTLKKTPANHFAELPIWLQQRWQKLMARCGRECERCQNLPLALSCYQLSDHREARARRLRVMELQASSDDDYHLLVAAAEQQLTLIQQPETRISIQRIRQRAAKKAGIKLPADSCKADLPRAINAYPSLQLTLADNDDHVEYQVMDYLNQQPGGQCFYVENTLLPGLFALLFWPAIYAPVSGAFFHPFQSGPADLFRDYFARLREEEINAAFLALQNGSYADVIRTRFTQKQGISCPLIHWGWLSADVVEKALAVIPAAQLEAIFRHLLRDLKNHGRGLPDLIWLGDKPGEWKLIEVKGPGDRLQDHQKLWLEFFLQQGIAAEVCYVVRPQ